MDLVGVLEEFDTSVNNEYAKPMSKSLSEVLQNSTTSQYMRILTPRHLGVFRSYGQGKVGHLKY